MNDDRRDEAAAVRVVLFSGGSGSRVLSSSLIQDPRVKLTLAINGYDDGKSTGEVRRLLPGSLGPSDYRKNASWLAGALGSCDTGLIELLDLRFPSGYPSDRGVAALGALMADSPPGGGMAGSSPDGGFEHTLRDALAAVTASGRAAVKTRLQPVLRELEETVQGFDFGDCSVGNLVFAGGYLGSDRDFNAAIADYCALLGLPSGLVENVSDGTNAHLVGIDGDGSLLATEAEIVESATPVKIKDIYLLGAPLTAAERRSLGALAADRLAAELESRSVSVPPNPRLLRRLRGADVIIYAPGTQHSSLFPSYLTAEVGTVIAANLRAVKLLITNIHEDAEISDTSAVELIQKAVHYLRSKGARPIPVPCLVTHYLLNDPTTVEGGAPYVSLGRLEQIEDPRLVRIGDYEEEGTGRHDATKVLAPFIQRFLSRNFEPSIGILLLETDSVDTITQTLLEMLRAGVESIPVSITVYYDSGEALEDDFRAALPFAARNVRGGDASGGFAALIDRESFDFFVLFESSGMYKGSDIVNVASLLSGGRFDAVWGSRRLSLTDIRQSYKVRYRQRLVLGAVSYLGSHVLSLAYLMLYGRYVTDTLSGVRAIRRRFLLPVKGDLAHRALNQRLLSLLLRDRAEIFETPVQFFSLGPDRVRRTGVADGLSSLLTILLWRWKSLPEVDAVPAAADPVDVS